MPLTKKGRKIMRAMRKEYGKKRGTAIFYASRNAGRIKDVDGVTVMHLNKPPR